jgi:hypothetical protein
MFHVVIDMYTPTVKVIDAAMDKIHTPNPRQSTKIIKEMNKTMSGPAGSKGGLTLDEIGKAIGYYNPQFIEPDVTALSNSGLLDKKEANIDGKPTTIYSLRSDWPEMVTRLAGAEAPKRAPPSEAEALTKELLKEAPKAAPKGPRPLTKAPVLVAQREAAKAAQQAAPQTVQPSADMKQVMSRIDTIENKLNDILAVMPKPKGVEKRAAARSDELTKKVQELEAVNKKLANENVELKTKFDRLRSTLAI